VRLAEGPLRDLAAGRAEGLTRALNGQGPGAGEARDGPTLKMKKLDVGALKREAEGRAGAAA
jgi:hypothetical protein